MNVERIKVKGWKGKERGLILAENEEWLLVQCIPVDYLLDGYKLYRKDSVLKRSTKSDEEMIAHVFGLKKLSNKAPTGFKLGSIESMLGWIEKKHGLFELQMKREEELFFGKLVEMEEEDLVVQLLAFDGSEDEENEYLFASKKIRAISFGSDYADSLRLLMEEQSQKTLKKV